MGVLGRYAVVDVRGDRAVSVTQLVGQTPTQCVAPGGRADDGASAVQVQVQVQDARATCARIRRSGASVVESSGPVHPHRDPVTHGTTQEVSPRPTNTLNAPPL